MRISKLDAARIQLDAAIAHYFRGEYVCAVTLAGAAEDILAGLLKNVGRETPFEFLRDWYQNTFGENLSKKQFSREIANPERNWLKHADEDVDTEIEITESDARMWLMRTLPCYYQLTKSHSPKMEQLFDHFRGNRGRTTNIPVPGTSSGNNDSIPHSGAG